MLQQILLTTIALPLVMGLVIALAATPGSRPRLALSAFLLPVAAAVASVAIEGLPAIPPVAAKHKLPLILLAGGIAFAVLALAIRRPFSRFAAAGTGLVALGLPAWWLGRNVLAANATKAGLVAAVLAITLVVLIGLVTADDDRRRNPPAAVPAALLWVSIATALAAVFGGYIGMAQMNGALAALTGGWLLVNYVRHLRGASAAFALDGVFGFSFIWTIVMGLVMTVLFAPSATPAAVVLAILPLAVAVVLIARQVAFGALPTALRPIAAGVATAVPAILAIVLAAVFARG